jgi:hypothetical protein
LKGLRRWGVRDDGGLLQCLVDLREGFIHPYVGIDVQERLVAPTFEENPRARKALTAVFNSMMDYR